MCGLKNAGAEEEKQDLAEIVEFLKEKTPNLRLELNQKFRG